MNTPMDGSEDLASLPAGVNQTRNASNVEHPKIRKKKVSFDLDIQVRTIPNRIPVYERQPAVYVTRTGHHPLAFVPRPLQFHSKHRQFLGNATSKHIVGLFTNSSFSTPVFQSGTGARGNFIRPHNKSMPQYFNYAAKNMYSLSSLRQSGKRSRAAANFKQITAALGDKIDENAEKQHKDGRARRIRSADSLPKVSTTHNNGDSSADVSNSHARSSTRLSHSAPTSQYQQRSPSSQLKSSNTQRNPASDAKGTCHTKEHNQSILKMRTISLNDSTNFNQHSELVPNPPKPKLDYTRKVFRQQMNPPVSYRVSRSVLKEHAENLSSSQGAPIETYVIPDTVCKNNINTKNRLLINPNERPAIAWATSADIHVQAPVLDVSVLRSSPVGHSGVNYVQMRNRPTTFSSKT